MMKEGPLVASVGGSLLNYEAKPGNITFNTLFIGELAQLFKERAALPHFKAFIVCGGGLLARAAINLALSQGITDPTVLDTLGIEQTHVNAREVTKQLVQVGVNTQYVKSWQEMSNESEDHHVLVTGGDVPGHTTDYVAVKIAEQQHQKTVINVSRSSSLFRPNPDGTPNMLKPITSMTWVEFFDTFKSVTYMPGLNFPVDPVAAGAAKNAGIDIVCFDGKKLGDLRNYLNTGVITGTQLRAE